MTIAATEERPAALDAKAALPRSVVRLLEERGAHTVGNGPALVTVSEAIALWRTRLRNTEITHAPLEGVEALLSALEKLPPQSKVDQAGYLGDDLAVTVFFRHSGGTYLGYAMLDKRKIPPARRRAYEQRRAALWNLLLKK